MTIEMGVVRAVLTFPDDGAESTITTTGSMLAWDNGVQPDDLPIGEAVIYTLGLDRLTAMLRHAAAGEDVDGLVLSLDAVALESDQHAVDDDEPCPPGYDREALFSTVLGHQALDGGACSCGWNEWGASFAAHVVDAYEAAAQ